MTVRDVFASLAAPARLRLRGWGLLLLYLAACAALLGLVAAFAVSHERDVIDGLAAYLFPDSWRTPARLLVTQLLATQEKEILVNAVVAGSLALVSLLLFPLKEKLSATFEREAGLTGEPGAGFPLLFEAREELKLFLFFLAAQSSIFWLGYPPDPARRAAALAISYLTVAAAFAMDFVTPLLQRHEVRFSAAARALAARPLRSLLWGALFGVPAALAGGLVARHASWGFARTVALVFAINVVAIAWAAVSGTWLGARLLPAARRTRRPHAVARGVAWLLLVGLLGWNGYRFAAVGLALHHKSAILKCGYAVDWKSAAVDLPSLGELTRATVEIGLAVDVTITNPTDRTVAIEDNRLELRHGETLLATSKLPVVTIPAAGRTTTTARFRLAVAPSAVLRGRELLRTEGYSLTLWLDVAPGFELPVYLIKRD